MRLFSILLVMAVAIGAFLIPDEALARPELAAEENATCAKCHVNPLGGGQRNATGFFFSHNLALEASTNALDKKDKSWRDFAPVVGEKLQLGMDARAMWHDMDEDEEIPDDQEPSANSTFYLMQAVFYADAKVLPVLDLVGAFDASQNTFEAYALIDDLPAGLYFKAGRFILPFGLRVDDHTILTRQMLGFHATGQDTGVEIGVRPGPAFVSAAISNGNLGQQAQDRDGDYYAVTGQAGVRFWKLGLGSSYFHNTQAGYDRDVYGGWGTFGVWKFTLIGEADLFKQEVDDLADPGETERITGSASFGQLDVEIIRGLYLQARYTHSDPDWDLEENYFDQTMAGFLIYPIPYFSFLGQYRFNREADDVDNNEILLQAHVWF
jgi:hypothetical protein